MNLIGDLLCFLPVPGDRAVKKVSGSCRCQSVAAESSQRVCACEYQ